MLFRELLRFRQDSTGCVPERILRALELPMPEDVFEQFVADHGTNEAFQQQYGDLDLHAIRWELAEIPASEICACSVFKHFNAVASIAKRARVIPSEGWGKVNLPRGAVEHWQTEGTWMRAPVMLRGELVRSLAALHLVEGHTRTGMLHGLVEVGLVSKASVHKVWIGEACDRPENDGPWRDVLKEAYMPFLDWLMGRIGDEGELGELADQLIDLEHGSRNRGGIPGDDLDAVLKAAARDEGLSQFRATIIQAHSEWERIMSS